MKTQASSPKLTIALASNDGAQNLLARLAHHIGDHVGQLHVHLRQRLLHELHVPALVAQQPAALTPQRAQRAHLLGGAERAVEQACGQELPSSQSVPVRPCQQLAYDRATSPIPAH